MTDLQTNPPKENPMTTTIGVPFKATAQQTALDWNLAVLADAIAEMDLAWREHDYAKQSDVRSRKAEPALEALRVITDDADSICGALVLAAAGTRDESDRKHLCSTRPGNPREAFELVTDYRNGTRGL